MLPVADVQVDHRRARRLAGLGGLDELLEGRGQLGKSAFASSAPVGATVIRVLVAVLRGVLAMGHIMAGRADATCPALWETVPS